MNINVPQIHKHNMNENEMFLDGGGRERRKKNYYIQWTLTVVKVRTQSSRNTRSDTRFISQNWNRAWSCAPNIYSHLLSYCKQNSPLTHLAREREKLCCLLVRKWTRNIYLGHFSLHSLSPVLCWLCDIASGLSWI